MGKLNKVQAALERRNGGGDDFYRSLSTLNELVGALKQPSASAAQVEAASGQITKEIKRLFDQLAKAQNSIISEVSKRPTSYTPLVEALASVSTKIDKFIDVVGSIELPTPVVQPPDLSHLDRRLDSIEAALMREDEEEETEDEPQEWTFQVNRTQGGYIKSVDAKKV